MSGKYPYETKSKGHTKADFMATCFTCGWECSSRNALGLAAQHAGRTGHQVSCDVTYSVLFGAWPEKKKGTNDE